MVVTRRRPHPRCCQALCALLTRRRRRHRYDPYAPVEEAGGPASGKAATQNMYERSKDLMAAARLTGGVEVDSSRGLWKGSGRLKGYRPPGSGVADNVPLVPPVLAPAPDGAAAAGEEEEESDLSSDSESDRRRAKKRKHKHKKERSHKHAKKHKRHSSSSEQSEEEKSDSRRKHKRSKHKRRRSPSSSRSKS